MSEALPFLPDDHFVAAMRIDLVTGEREGEIRGRTRLEPSMQGPTGRPRLAILATMVDVVAGHVPDGPRTPTVDLRVQLTGDVPAEGEAALVARPDRIGRKLVVAETGIADAGGRVFARASTTFMNRRIGSGLLDAGEPRGRPVDSFERLVGARVSEGGALDVDPAPRLANGHVGTVQGGVQAFLAELAAERLAGPGAVATDLHVRYLSAVRAGPLRARARAAGEVGPLVAVRVDLSDAGDGERLAAVVWLTLLRR